MDFKPSRFEVLPTVVKNLLIINALLFIATIVFSKVGRSGIDITTYLALHNWESPDFKIWQLVTHLFLHGNVVGVNADYQGGFMHLFSNMFALWMFGSILENTWGAKRFLQFYLFCGVGAALCHLGVLSYEYRSLLNAIHQYSTHPTYDQFSLFLNNHLSNQQFTPQFYSFLSDWSQHPTDNLYSSESISIINQYANTQLNEATVGASGAVFGILFAFGYLFPNTLLYLYFFVPIKAKYFIALYALFELYAGIRNSAGDNIAHYAHLGGMLFAFILLLIWKQRKNSFY